VNADLREIVDGIVAPMAGIAPAERRRARRRDRQRLVLALVLVTAVVLIAVATAWKVLESTEPAPTPVSPGGELACLDLVGGTAARAEGVLRDRGFVIEWRLVRYHADGATFTATTEAAVPQSAIVEDVDRGRDATAIVFVHAADDAYAPIPVPLPCPQ
jgi:hypothetical protein